jgi:2-dehydropantoate 2-reductase
MRGQHYETSISKGLNVTSIDGVIFIPPESLQAYPHTKDMGTADWVVVALKSTSLDAIPDLISPLLHSDTRVLVIMNGLVEDDLLCAMKDAGAEYHALYGGMALICVNRVAPGRVDHSYAGLLTGGVATSKGTAETDRIAFESLWKPTRVEIGYEESLLRGRWKKCVWNLPFNGISVAMGGITVDIIVNDPGLRRLANLVMDETIAAANADLSSHGAPLTHYLGDTDVRGSLRAQVACNTVYVPAVSPHVFLSFFACRNS